MVKNGNSTLHRALAKKSRRRAIKVPGWLAAYLQAAPLTLILAASSFTPAGDDPDRQLLGL